MTDIVERLRQVRGDNEDARAAAAEIVRLMAAHTDKVELVLRLQAANARLRAALQSMLTDPPATLDEPDTDAEVIIKMRCIARRALEPKP